MNIDFYRNYIEIVDCGTLSGAARNLHVAQSALSNQLKQFEEEYGAQLLVRSSRKMTLTDAGYILYKRSKDIVSLVDASFKEIDACVGGSHGILRLGVTQAYPDPFVNKMLIGYREKFPKVQFELREEDSNEVMELLKNGVIEIAITRTFGTLPSIYQEIASVEETMCVYCKRKNKWIREDYKAVNFRDLQNMPLAISRGVEDQLKEMFNRSDISPEILCVSTSRSNPMMWGRAGAAVGIIRTSNFDNLNNEDSICLPLVSDDPLIGQLIHTSRTVITMKNTVLSAAGNSFTEYIKGYVENHLSEEDPGL